MSAVSASAGSLAGAMTGGKTGAALESVGKFSSPSEFIQNEKEKASQSATIDKRVFDRNRDKEANQNVVDGIMDRAGVGHADETAQQLVKAGVAKFKNGKLVATTGQQFRDGMATLSSGDMDTTKQLVVDGQRFNIDRDGAGKGVLVSRDSSENTKGGMNTDFAVLGFLGDASSFIAESAAGAMSLDYIAQKAGMKNGIIKPAINKVGNLFGYDDVFKSSNGKVNKGSSDNHSNSNNTFEEQSNKSGNHSKSFRQTNYAGQPNANHSVNQTKGIVSNISDYVKTSPLGRFAAEAYDSAKTTLGKNKRTAMSIAAATAVVGFATNSNASTIKPIETPTPTPNKADSTASKAEDAAELGVVDQASLGLNALQAGMGLKEAKDGVAATSIVKDLGMGVKEAGSLGKFAMKKYRDSDLL